jgi:hypothetical protein
MLEYSPWPKAHFGSIEQARREAQALADLLSDSKAVARIFRDLPGAVGGVCQTEAKAAVNIAVDADTGHLRIIVAETDLLPGHDDGALLVWSGDPRGGV